MRPKARVAKGPARVGWSAKLVPSIPMTDTFANGPSAPGGATPNATPQAGDVTGTLAELERKLRELERELTSIGRRRTLTGATPAQIASGPPPRQAGDWWTRRSSLRTPTRAPNAGHRRERRSSRPQLGSRRRSSRPSWAADASRALGPASQPVRSTRPQERPRPSEAQLASLAELRRFRDRLERFARELAAEYDALLGRVMSGLTSTSPRRPRPPRRRPSRIHAGGHASPPPPTADIAARRPPLRTPARQTMPCSRAAWSWAWGRSTTSPR